MGPPGSMRRHGDEVASLFAAHAGGLVRLAELLAGDRGLAEDLVQEAFVRAWRSWPRLRNQQAALAQVRAAMTPASPWQARLASSLPFRLAHSSRLAIPSSPWPTTRTLPIASAD